MAAPPTTTPLTLEQQELALLRTVIQARGWTVTDARVGETDLIIIATRRRAPQPLEAERLPDLT